MLFALDTATDTASIALFDKESYQLLAEMTWKARRRHTQDLLPQIQHLFALMGVAPPDLTALAVTTGPGSFTGVRIGVSIVKGMALGLATPLRIVGAPTLIVTAWPWLTAAAQAAAVVCAFIRAGRGRYNWVFFAPNDDLRRPSAEDHHMGAAREFAASLAEASSQPIWLVGELDDGLRQHVCALAHVTVIDPIIGQRRAGHLAQIAQRLLGAGVEDSAEALQPLYLRAP